MHETIDSRGGGVSLSYVRLIIFFSTMEFYESTIFLKISWNYNKKNQLYILPVLLPHVLYLQKLPHYHKDPFDRLLVGHAQENAILITLDPQLEKHSIQTLK